MLENSSNVCYLTDKIWHIHTMEYSPTNKRTTQMIPENIMLCEESQTKSHIFHLYEIATIGKYIETDSNHLRI